MQEMVTRRLVAVAPTVAAYFGVSVAVAEAPNFLVYRRGDFFSAHRDASDREYMPEYIRRRRLGVILFLNRQAARPEPGAFCGGALGFYRLHTRDGQEVVRAGIRAEAGTLVAFPSTRRPREPKASAAEGGDRGSAPVGRGARRSASRSLLPRDGDRGVQRCRGGRRLGHSERPDVWRSAPCSGEFRRVPRRRPEARTSAQRLRRRRRGQGPVSTVRDQAEHSSAGASRDPRSPCPQSSASLVIPDEN